MDAKQILVLLGVLLLGNLALARYRRRPEMPIELDILPERLKRFEREFSYALNKYYVDPALLAALVIQESGGNPDAYRHEPEYQAKYVTGKARWNSARALGWTDELLATSWGLTQVLGTTAWEMGFKYPPEKILDPASNLALGAKYLRMKLDQYKGNVTEALLAYNGGDGAVHAYRAGRPYNLSYALNVLALRDRIIRGELD